MRKVITFAAAVLLACSAARAESADLSGMSVQELETLKSRIVSELEAREPVETTLDFIPGEKTVLVNQDGLKIYLTGRWQDEPYGQDLYLEIAIENDSDRAVTIWGNDCSLNGWNLRLPVVFPQMKPGEKEARTLSLSYSSAMLNSYADMKTLRLTLQAEPVEGSPVNYGPLEIHFHFQGE